MITTDVRLKSALVDALIEVRPKTFTIEGIESALHELEEQIPLWETDSHVSFRCRICGHRVNQSDWRARVIHADAELSSLAKCAISRLERRRVNLKQRG